MQEIESLFAEKSLRLTDPRRKLYAALKESNSPLTIAQLIKKCPGIDRTSVYRTLDLFESLGIASSTHIAWKKVYELSSPYKPHHHHFHCEVCGSFEDIESELFEGLIEEMAQKNGFRATSHMFEVKGICRNCHTDSAHVV